MKPAGGQALWASRGRTAFRVPASAAHSASQMPRTTVSALLGGLSMVPVTGRLTHPEVFLLQEFLHPERPAGDTQTRRHAASLREQHAADEALPSACLHPRSDFS